MLGQAATRPCWGRLRSTANQVLGAVGVVSNVAGGVDRIAQGDIVGGLLDLAAAGVSARRMAACFSGDTKLRARGTWGNGWRRIDEFTMDDEVLSRPEGDPNGPLQWKKVLQLFRGLGRVCNLHIGGKVIATTPEHPFAEYSKKWTPAGALEQDDLLLGMEQERTAVEEVFDTGEYVTVYNVEVEDFHTYVVGGEDWGFSVWCTTVIHVLLLKRQDRLLPVRILAELENLQRAVQLLIQCIPKPIPVAKRCKLRCTMQTVMSSLI